MSDSNPKPHGYVQAKSLRDDFVGCTKGKVYSGFIDFKGDLFFLDDRHHLACLAAPEYEIIPNGDHRHEFYTGQEVLASQNNMHWYKDMFITYANYEYGVLNFICANKRAKYCKPYPKEKPKLSAILKHEGLTIDDVEVDV